MGGSGDQLVDQVFTIAEVNELCDKAVELVKTNRFDPDLIVGITTGGAILGKIISKKLGIRFCPDYRRKRVSVHFPLPMDARKILIVDDKFDSGNTVRRCFEEIINKLHPELSKVSETYGQKLKSPPDLDIQVLAFFNSMTSYVDPHYRIRESLDYELPWDRHDNKFTNGKLRELINTCGYPWAEDVLELMEELSNYRPYSLDKSYENRPLPSELLKQFSGEIGKVMYQITVGEEPEEQNVIVSLREAGLMSETQDFGENTHIVSLREDNRANVLVMKIMPNSKLIELRFVPDELRTFAEMCKNCDIEDRGNICETCNSYVRSLDILKRVRRALEDIYTITAVKTIIENSSCKLEYVK